MPDSDKFFKDPTDVDCVENKAGKFKLGLLMPIGFPTVAPKFSTKIELFDEYQLKDFLSDPNRTKRRDLFSSDWIKDQNGIGACNGYAGASVLERAFYLRGNGRIKLSGDGLYAAINGGRDQGSMLDDGMDWIQKNGIPPEDLVPRHEWRKNRIPAEAYEQGKRFLGFECYAADSEPELLTGLALGFVGVVATHVSGNYSSLNGEGISQGGNGPGNHAVGVDDAKYSTRSGQFLIDKFNSWSTRWGDMGRCYLSWNKHLKESTKYHRFYLIRSTSDDPYGDNPNA